MPEKKVDWQQRDIDEGEKLAGLVSKFINIMCMEGRVNAFCRKMGREHRTLQQSFSKLCYAWIKFQSEQFDAGNYDGRNEYACKVAHKIMTDEDLKYETNLPMI
jgi:hypothetical protein